MTQPRLLSARRVSRGMTLIEVLVGIAIGLIGMLVMFQMVSVWDARTRVAASSGDSQVAGTLAMFNLERDLKLAGMGFGTAGAAEAGCLVNAYDNVASGAANFNLRPVNIVDGDLAGVPDSIEVLYGGSPFSGDNQDVLNATATTLTTRLKYGFKRGDLAILTNGASVCRLIQITDDTSADSSLLAYAPGTFDDYYSGNPTKLVRWNSASASMPLITAGILYSLGPSPRRNEWSVNTANTTLGYINRLSTVDVNQFLGVAEGVIDMKAQYGYDADNNKAITAAEWNKTAPVDWTLVKAVRVAILVRGREFVKSPSASAADSPRYRLTAPPTWFGTNFAMKNVDGSADTDPAGSPNNWRYYRYRVYEKVIPLRNMMWGAP